MAAVSMSSTSPIRVTRREFESFVDGHRYIAVVPITLDFDAAVGSVDFDNGFFLIATGGARRQRDDHAEQKQMNVVLNRFHERAWLGARRLRPR